MTNQEIVDSILDPIPSTHHPIFKLGPGHPGTFYCMDKDNLKVVFKGALDAKDADHKDREMRLTDGDVKDIAKVFEECEFSKDDGDCDYCDRPTARTWYERTSHEYDEGNYYCDLCALKAVMGFDHMGEWYEKTHYKEEAARLEARLSEAEQIIENLINGINAVRLHGADFGFYEIGIEKANEFIKNKDGLK